MRQFILTTILFWLCYIPCVQGQNFMDGFSIQAIPDSIWQRMQGRSYQPNQVIGREDLSYLRLLHWDDDGKTHQGEMVCNRLIAEKLIMIFQELYRHHYPIQQIKLPDDYDADDERQMRANNTSCFCYRPVSGSAKLSYHARGLAVDINPLYNPYVKTLKNGRLKVQPANATAYCDRSRSFRYKISKGDLCYQLFIRHGFTWGGAWRSLKDYQHFEYRQIK